MPSHHSREKSYQTFPPERAIRAMSVCLIKETAHVRVPDYPFEPDRGIGRSHLTFRRSDPPICR